MIKLRSKRFCRGSFKLGGINNNSNNSVKGSEKGSCGSINNSEIKWELRPGGMLVQKRECGDSVGELITVKVSTLSQWHDISIEATSTFGELKMVLSLVTGLEPREQRLLFKGKEREDGEYLHMLGVRDKDKVFLLEDPAIKERKLHSMAGGQPIGTPCRTISV
ncbi:BAG family molecular chaperone regulator 2 [Ricinus communis]|uniref:Protein binding protein, putative n=1 Tax=Ricinus communis TaxID=3988 RepID=B9SLT0_RICCO|nr:BAG family molecular chaperone regulator 2 [Ricinus communis]EEF35436.1 protein binding protein, putative [Ricinus communis]|eukprot:XP_002526949.1 BAG family molecular chaperone regulator 2 [Ricinus communis]